MILQLNFILIYILKVTKLSFSRPSINKLLEIAGKASCYYHWSIFLHFVTISVIQQKYSSRYFLCLFLKVFRKKYVPQLFSEMDALNRSTNLRKNTSFLPRNRLTACEKSFGKTGCIGRISLFLFFMLFVSFICLFVVLLSFL